jgi:hypothetical protein
VVEDNNVACDSEGTSHCGKYEQHQIT